MRDTILLPREAAREIQRPEREVVAAAERGELAAVCLAGRWRITRSALRAYTAGCGRRAA